MQFHVTNIKNRLWVFLITGILLILSAIFIQGYFSYQNSASKISQKFQSVFSEKEKKISAKLNLLIKENKGHIISAEWKKFQILPGSISRRRICFFSFMKKILLYIGLATPFRVLKQ